VHGWALLDTPQVSYLLGIAQRSNSAGCLTEGVQL
jgi:hypothetical protein